MSTNVLKESYTTVAAIIAKTWKGLTVVFAHTEWNLMHRTRNVQEVSCIPLLIIVTDFV